MKWDKQDFLTAARALQKARSYMEVALELLDQAGAAADIGAHLDLAICRLTEALAADPAARACPGATLPD